MEESIDVKGYEGLYKITKTGLVFSVKIEKFINPYLNQGYLRVYFYDDDGKHIMKQIHVLLAEHFLENPDNKSHVFHINGVKTDNRLENLKFVTSSELHTRRNVQSNNKLGIKGIIQSEYGYRATIVRNGEKFTKTFKKLEDAIEWRQEKEIELSGEFRKV